MAKNPEKKPVETVTSTITAKTLIAFIKKEDESIGLLRQNLYIFLKNGIKGKVFSPGDIINPLCFKTCQVKNLSKARTAKVDCLKELERVNNFVTSWMDFDKKGTFTLRLTNKKVEALKKGKEDAEKNKDDDNKQVVTFKKASLITLLDQFIDSDNATRAQKRVALELAELLEADK